MRTSELVEAIKALVESNRTLRNSLRDLIAEAESSRLPDHDLTKAREVLANAERLAQ